MSGSVDALAFDAFAGAIPHQPGPTTEVNTRGLSVCRANQRRTSHRLTRPRVDERRDHFDNNSLSNGLLNLGF